jgi:hypothetical protein
LRPDGGLERMAGMNDIGTFLYWLKTPLYILLLCRLLSVRKYSQPETNQARKFFASKPMKYFLVAGLSAELIRDIVRIVENHRTH